MVQPVLQWVRQKRCFGRREKRKRKKHTHTHTHTIAGKKRQRQEKIREWSNLVSFFKTTLFGHISKKLLAHSLFGAWSFLLIHIRFTPSEGPNHQVAHGKKSHLPWSNFMVHGVNWPWNNRFLLFSGGTLVCDKFPLGQQKCFLVEVNVHPICSQWIDHPPNKMPPMHTNYQWVSSVTTRIYTTWDLWRIRKLIHHGWRGSNKTNLLQDQGSIHSNSTPLDWYEVPDTISEVKSSLNNVCIT